MRTHVFLAMICFSLLSASQLRAQLPPDAQEAVKKGIIAAKEQDYQLAIRYFQDARKIAPNSSEIFYNLGLAESKIPGRELRAICWFGAYLSMDTNAPNAAAVKDQIDELDVKSQSNLSHLIQSLQDEANQASPYKYDDLLHVANLWAEAGDLRAAMKIAESFQAPQHDYKDWAIADIAVAQAETGDISNALKTTDLIRDNYSKGPAYVSIIQAQIKAGDIVSSLNIVPMIQENNARLTAMRDIVKAQERAGDLKGAIIFAKKIGDQTENFDKAEAMTHLADLQVRAGDTIEANISLEAALKNVDSINVQLLDIILPDIAHIQVKVGDVDGAIKTAELPKIIDDKEGILWDIAETQLNAGNIDGARKTAEHMDKTESLTALLLAHIVSAQLERGATATALGIAVQIYSDEKRSDALEEIVKSQAKAGDILGAQRTAEMIPQIDIGKSKSLSLSYLSEAQEKTGDTIGALRTANSIPDTVLKIVHLASAGDIVGALKTADLIQGESDRGDCLRYIVAAQANSNDIKAALKTVDLIKYPEPKCEALVSIAENQSKAGDISGAQKTIAIAIQNAAIIQNPQRKSFVQAIISKTQAKFTITNVTMEAAKETSGMQVPLPSVAASWIEILDDKTELNTDPFLDLTSYLASQHSDDPDKLFESLVTTTRQIIKAQNVIDRMLKQ